MTGRVISPVTHISYLKQNFILTNTPTRDNIGTYISVLLREKCRYLVCTCVVTNNVIDVNLFTKFGITVVNLSFPVGSFPTDDVIDKWLSLLREIGESKNQTNSVAVNCLSGLGRAPVLIAIAMIESHCPYMDAISMIRKKRPGAFNRKQILFLETYKQRLSHNYKSSVDINSSCVIL